MLQKMRCAGDESTVSRPAPPSPLLAQPPPPPPRRSLTVPAQRLVERLRDQPLRGSLLGLGLAQGPSNKLQVIVCLQLRVRCGGKFFFSE